MSKGECRPSWGRKEDGVAFLVGWYPSSFLPQADSFQSLGDDAFADFQRSSRCLGVPEGCWHAAKK